MKWAQRDARPEHCDKRLNGGCTAERRKVSPFTATPETGLLAARASRTSDAFAALLREVAQPIEAWPRTVPLTAGSTLVGGRLRVGRCIGEGGMGAVHEAYDVERGTMLALKTLLRLDGANIYRLKNEFRALLTVRHRNLVALHELFADEQRWFFTMELVRGQRFDHWVRPGGALDESRLRSALAQLAAAVEAIHAAGKLHRDLKPSNVLVTRAGSLRVLDFGLAADALPGGIGQTLIEATISGTPAYLAPEQVASAPATAASDAYALGVMLFQALTGVLPFAGGLHEILADKQTRDAPAVRSLQPDAPATLSGLCDALLARDPAGRPSAADVCARLGRSRADQARARMRASRVPPFTPRARTAAALRAELAVLHRAYAHCRDGRAAVVLLSGPRRETSARMLRFTRVLAHEGQAVVLSGVCSARERVPLNGLDGLVDDLSRHLRKLDAIDAAALMPRDVHALAQVFPVLGRVEAVSRAPRRPARSSDLRARALTALWELLSRAADRGPLVLHIANAQWMDRDSCDALVHVLGHADPPAALLVLQCGPPGGVVTLHALRAVARSNPRVRFFHSALSQSHAIKSTRSDVRPTSR